MIALGLFGQKCYLGDTWNRLDFFIVMAGYGPCGPKVGAAPVVAPVPDSLAGSPGGPPAKGMGVPSAREGDAAPGAPCAGSGDRQTL